MKNKLGTILFIFFCFSGSVFAQWQACNGTAGLNMQSLLTNGNYNFAGGATGAYLSSDSAASYSLSNNGNDAVGPTRGFTKDSNYVYTCTSKGVFRSADNGATWVSKSAGLTNLLGSGILKVGTRLFYVGPTGIFMSINQAENWNAAGLSTTDVRCITAIKDTLFVGTNGAGIYKSIDWGVNWLAINNGLGASLNFRAMESKGNTLFAAGPIGTGVYRSIDFGATWTLLGGGLATGSYRGFASNANLIIAGSFGGGVFYSINNGDNWTTINAGLSDLTIFDLELNDHYIIAATNTQGVFRFPIAALNLTSGITSNDAINSFVLYPNPCANQINFKVAGKYIGANYTLYNYLGKTILSGIIKEENTILPMENLTSGIYFLTFPAHSKQSFKIIKS